MRTPAPLPPLLRTQSVRLSTARDAGASTRRLRGPDVRRPLHGVVTALPELALDDVCRAYLTVRAPGAFFSGPTAAELHGLPLPATSRWRTTNTLDITVPTPERAPRRAGIRGHTARVNLGDVVVRHGLPMSSPERTWCELGTRLPVEELIVVGDRLIATHSGITDTARLRAALARSPARRGRPALSTALGLLHPGSASPQESRLRLRLQLAGVRGGEPDLTVRSTTGGHYRGSLVFRANRLILVYRDDRPRDRDPHLRDVSRRLDLQSDGWTVVELGASDIAAEKLVPLVRTLLLRPARPPEGAVTGASAPGPTP